MQFAMLSTAVAVGVTIFSIDGGSPLARIAADPVVSPLDSADPSGTRGRAPASSLAAWPWIPAIPVPEPTEGAPVDISVNTSLSRISNIGGIAATSKLDAGNPTPDVAGPPGGPWVALDWLRIWFEQLVSLLTPGNAE